MGRARSKVVAGQVYGNLVLLTEGQPRSGYRTVNVSCVCGVQKTIRLDGLTSGRVKSCGCQRPQNGLKHGHRRSGTHDPTYTSWDSMWQRCGNPNSPAYDYYGGRGITPDPRWKDFATFLSDMGPRPSRDYELDRINNDLGYFKGNCRWLPKPLQSRNRRYTLTANLDGKEVTVWEMSQMSGLPQDLIRQRLRNGWTAGDAVTTPKRKKS